MINSEISPSTPEAPPAPHVVTSARGAALIALIAALVVCGIWFTFYLVVFLPRATP
jgi:hypothetical protein